MEATPPAGLSRAAERVRAVWADDETYRRGVAETLAGADFRLRFEKGRDYSRPFMPCHAVPSLCTAVQNAHAASPG
jgi:hypothetical protein